MSKLFLVLLCFAHFALQSQSGIPPFGGARGAAMGNASVCFDDAQSVFTNQAGMAFLNHNSFTAFGQSRFVSTGINGFNGGAVIHTRSGNFGLQLGYFGIPSFNEQKIGLAYGRKLAKEFSIGVQVNYLSSSIEELGNASSFNVEAGFLAYPIENLTVGAHVYNPIPQKINSIDYHPSLIRVGLAYVFSEKLLISAQGDKDTENPLQFRAGLEYNLVQALDFRLGIQTQPSQMAFGLGLKVQNIQLDFASQYHRQLGFTPAFGITYPSK